MYSYICKKCGKGGQLNTRMTCKSCGSANVTVFDDGGKYGKKPNAKQQKIIAAGLKEEQKRRSEESDPFGLF